MDLRSARPASGLLFLAILGGAIGAAVLLMPRLGIATTVVLVQIGAVLAIMASERVLPYRREWLRTHGDLRTDLGHALISGIGVTRLAEIAVRTGGVVVAAWLAGYTGGSLWPSAWPLLAQLALALPVAELPQYWVHRLQHEQDILWRFHAVHHSAPRLYWLNAGRFHPVDIGLLYVVGYLPLVALGCPPEVIALFALFDAVFGMLQHANIDLHLGPLNRVFSAAEPHRWHHSRSLAEANTNYGSNLIVWDLVFGTFFLPADREPPTDIGIADMPGFPTGYLAQLWSPFRWRRVRREALIAA